MNRFVLIFITIVGFAVEIFAEPKFRYIDTENKDKPKDENANTPPPKPAYYDAYKKNIKPVVVQPAAPVPANPPQLSEEEMKKITEALRKAKEEPPKTSSDDYANPSKAKPKTEEN